MTNQNNTLVSGISTKKKKVILHNLN